MSSIPKDQGGCKDFGSIAKALVNNSIVTSPDNDIRKERILIAREAGLFTESETQDWIRIYGLSAA